jgi:ABC-2 type transport system ATP-binding protein
MTTAIDIQNVSKTFRSKTKVVRALSGVSFSIGKGEIFGLLGPNGAGKTTIISILCGLLDADDGSANILGMDVSKDSLEIKRKINFVPGFTNIGLNLTVTEFLKYYCLLYNLDDAKQRIKRVMKLVEIEDRSEDLTLDLSSGYKQRLLFAKALLNDPAILFLDEPTVGLDLEISITIRNLIKKLRDQGKTILLTTHNMYEAEELCDRIALISKGKIILSGTVAQIKKNIVAENQTEIQATRPEILMKSLAKLSFVKRCDIRNGMITVSLKERASERLLLKFLSESSEEIYSVARAEPTLEEAFLKIMRRQHA